MKPEELARNVAAGEIGPLYCLYGEEGYLVERAVKGIVDRIASPDFRDFNFTLLYGNECRGGEIVEAAQTLPMFADRRVVLVKRGGELPAAAQEPLAGYLADPSPSTCLILQAEKIDQRKKLFVEWKKRGEIVEFRRPYENQLLPFVREEAAARGKRLDSAAAELLIYLVGNSLQELVSQLDKLVTFVGARPGIGIDDVRTMVADTRVESVFELVNALGGKDLRRGVRSLQTILRDGEEPIKVLGMVSRHFRQLWRVAELLERKTPQTEIGRAVGISPYFLKGIVEQAHNFTLSEFKRVFELLLATDTALKSSGGRPAILMERLLFEVCGSPGPPCRSEGK